MLGTLIMPRLFFQDNQSHLEIDLPRSIHRHRHQQQGKTSSTIVYIAGRLADLGDSALLDELHLSVLSACYAQAQSSNPDQHLHFIFFVSENDYDSCSTFSSLPCDFSPITQSCTSLYIHSSFEFAVLNKEILKLWKEHTGVVGFSHHSTWFGYAKIWLPILLANYTSAVFLDTDTLWNLAPSVIFDELQNFNSSQVIGATSLVGREKGHSSSLSFVNRVTSGVLLFDLGKIHHSLQWADVVMKSISSNRGVNNREPIPSEYNQSQHCEQFHWGEYQMPFCTVDPLIIDLDENFKLKDLKLSGDDSLLLDCKESRACWKTSPQSGDQEFYSAIFSNENPELLYELPKHHQMIKMGPWKDFQGFNNDSSMTLIHSPQISELWDPELDIKLASVLPSSAYDDSLNEFRKRVKNITVG